MHRLFQKLILDLMVVNLFVISINRLAFLFYEFHVRIFFLYNDKNAKGHGGFQFIKMSKIYGASMASIFLGFNMALIAHYLTNLFSFNIEFRNFSAMLIFGTASYVISYLTIDKGNFFEKQFLPNEKKIPNIERFKHHLLSILIWFSIPTLFILSHI